MKQIIAMGGGGFTMEPDNPLLDLYVLLQSNNTKPKICLLPTASGDSKTYIERFYDRYLHYDCEPTHLSLFNPPTKDLESFLLEQDIIYVSGGSTINMITLWELWNVDNILKKAWENEIVLAGVSSGSVCWFEEGITDSIPGTLSKERRCLGFLPGSHSAHYDNPERRPTFHKLILSGDLKNGIAADNFAALHFKESSLYTVVSSRPMAHAYKVFKQDDKIVEEPLPTIYLGDFL